MFESCDEELVVFAFYGHFHELLHIVLGVPGRFKMTVRPDTSLRAWPKTRHFRVLWSYPSAIAHIFGVPRQFTCLRVMRKNLSFFAFYVHFHELLTIVLCAAGRFKMNLRPGTCLSAWTKTRCFRVLWRFSWAIAHSFGIPGGFAWP